MWLLIRVIITFSVAVFHLRNTDWSLGPMRNTAIRRPPIAVYFLMRHCVFCLKSKFPSILIVVDELNPLPFKKQSSNQTSKQSQPLVSQ